MLVAVMVLVLGSGGSASGQLITAIERHNSSNAPPEIAEQPLGEAVPCFVDRTHVYRNVPVSLAGAEYVLLANADKTVADHELIVTLAQPAVVYLLLDNRLGHGNVLVPDPDMVADPAAAGMSWVSTLGFVDTGLNVGIDEMADGDIDNWSSVYVQEFPAGPLVLGQQNDLTDPVHKNMFGVAAKPAPVSGRSFTYQGYLSDQAAPADGLYDLQFSLFDRKYGGTQQGTANILEDQDVVEGYFTALLDFGDGVFDGNDCWLEIGVRPGASTGSYTILEPRQPITPTPYALYAFSGPQGDSGDSGDSYWVPNGTDIYYASGNVGIGTSSPLYALHVHGQAISGFNSDASGAAATVSGGSGNTASGASATVCGGENHTASAWGATVSGGTGNTASMKHATVGGGYQNKASGHWTTVSGGYKNEAGANDATISGGTHNEASGENATISGGGSNTASGNWATVCGGINHTASAWGATVCGGYTNTASGDYSFAAGYRAKAIHRGAFVWADNQWEDDEDVSSVADNSFTVRAEGPIWFGWHSPPAGLPAGRYIHTSTGAWLSRAGGWHNASDRNKKENITEVDAGDVLHTLMDVPISTWSYKEEDPAVRHMGPMAQDLYAAFGLGDDETSISTIDSGGISFAAIQGLYELVQEKDAKIDVLERRLAAMESLVEKLISEKQAD